MTAAGGGPSPHASAASAASAFSVAVTEPGKSAIARTYSRAAFPGTRSVNHGRSRYRRAGSGAAAGVAVIYKHFPGQFHGFFTMGKLLPQANIAATEIAGWLKALN